ncbi:MAG: hypothetical protein ABI700_15995 [Chloroflexota bacterium]
MKLADLSTETIERIKAVRFDRILEKHEGSWGWDAQFKYGDPEFMTIEGLAVLLPIDKDQHPNITILRTAMCQDKQTPTLFLKDTTYVSDPRWEDFEAGRIAICEKMPGEDFYLTTVYHEWFILPPFG